MGEEMSAPLSKRTMQTADGPNLSVESKAKAAVVEAEGSDKLLMSGYIMVQYSRRAYHRREPAASDRMNEKFSSADNSGSVKHMDTCPQWTHCERKC